MDSQKHSKRPYIFVEILLYSSISIRVFAEYLGVLKLSGLSGALIIISGLTCFLIMASLSDKFPVSLLFIVVINLFANITDYYINEHMSKDMLFWLSLFLMGSYVVREHTGALRFAFFLAVIILISVLLEGEMSGIQEGYQRLGLSSDSVGTMFANSNALAQFAGVTGIALLFLGLQSSWPIKFLSWSVALALFVVVLLAVSRTGLILVLVGSSFFLFALCRSYKFFGVFVFGILIIGLIAFMSTYGVNEYVDAYSFRFSQDSGRLAQLDSVGSDLVDTLFAGHGQDEGLTSTGFLPHNAFLRMHLAYGGVCAWFYVAWLLWLGVETFRCARSEALSVILRIETVAMYLVFILVQPVTISPAFNYGFILGVALIERNILKLRMHSAASEELRDGATGGPLHVESLSA